MQPLAPFLFSLACRSQLWSSEHLLSLRKPLPRSKQSGRQARSQKHEPSEVEGMGDTWKLYKSLVLSGTISIGMCQSGRVLVTAHGDNALGQQKAQVRAVCFLSLQDSTPYPLACSNRPPKSTWPPRSKRKSSSHPLRPAWSLPGPIHLTWSQGPLNLQVLPHETLCCVAAVVIRQGGAAEAIGEGIRAGVPV